MMAWMVFWWMLGALLFGFVLLAVVGLIRRRPGPTDGSHRGP
jgi:hypothetical protein